MTLLLGATAEAQERAPWSNPDRYTNPSRSEERPAPGYGNRSSSDVERSESLPPPQTFGQGGGQGYGGQPQSYGQPGAAEPPYSSSPRAGSSTARRDDAYRAPRTDTYEQPPYQPAYPDRAAGPERAPDDLRYGAPYRTAPPPSRNAYNEAPPPRRYDDEQPRDGTFSMREITQAGHGFFGSLSQGLASVIEHAFKSKGRPNGYILGEDLGGAFVAGLRYGEGNLYTRDAGTHKVYWQGPSLGFDAGAEGSKVMVLVYNMRDPDDIYHRFGGIAGSAYVVGGAGLTFQSHGDMVVAPIRAGIGLRLGANIGYLKYTRRPTWNPF